MKLPRKDFYHALFIQPIPVRGEKNVLTFETQIIISLTPQR